MCSGFDVLLNTFESKNTANIVRSLWKIVLLPMENRLVAAVENDRIILRRND